VGRGLRRTGILRDKEVRAQTGREGRSAAEREGAANYYSVIICHSEMGDVPGIGDSQLSTESTGLARHGLASRLSREAKGGAAACAAPVGPCGQVGQGEGLSLDSAVHCFEQQPLGNRVAMGLEVDVTGSLGEDRYDHQGTQDEAPGRRNLELPNASDRGFTSRRKCR
jgi:hypothetical protein